MTKFSELPRDIKIRLILTFFVSLVGSTVTPLMVLYYTRELGRAIAGIFIIIVQITSLLSGLWGGHVADSWGRHRPIVLGMGTVVLGCLLTVFSQGALQNPYVIWFGFLLVDTGYAFADPALEAMIIDLSTQQNRKYIYSLRYWLLNLAVMVGAVVGGALFDHYFIYLLIAFLIVEAVSAYIMIFVFSETLPVTKRSQQKTTFSAMIKNYWGVTKDRRWLVYIAGMLGLSILLGIPENYMPAHLASEYQVVTLLGQQITPAKMVSLLLVINTILIVLGMNFIIRLFERWSTLKQFTLGAVCFGGSMVAMLWLNSFWPLVVMIIVATFGEMVEVPASQTMKVEMMNPHKVGAYSGFSMIVRPSANILLGSLLTLSHWVGDRGISLAVILVTIVVILLINKAFQMPKAWQE